MERHTDPFENPEPPSDLPGLQPFPFALPDRFLEQIGYRGPDQLVGLYWELAGDELAVYDRRSHWVGAHDHLPWVNLMHRPDVVHWRYEHYVSFYRDPVWEQHESHHLLIERPHNRAFVASRPLAIEVVTSQCFSPRRFFS